MKELFGQLAKLAGLIILALIIKAYTVDVPGVYVFFGIGVLTILFLGMRELERIHTTLRERLPVRRDDY